MLFHISEVEKRQKVLDEEYNDKLEMLHNLENQRQNLEEEKYSAFLFIIGERGREIFNTWTWDKIKVEGVETEEDNITVKMLFQKFEEYCLPRRNLVVERRRFFLHNQKPDESVDGYVTELKNLSSACEFENIKEGMILYKLVDGVQSDRIRDTQLRKGADLTLQIAIDICKADESTQQEMRLMKHTIEVDAVSKHRRKHKRKTTKYHAFLNVLQLSTFG